MTKTILVTGAAGFIGSHVVQAFLERDDAVVGVDNFNDYYDPNRKRANLTEVLASEKAANLTLVEGDVRDSECIHDLYRAHSFDAIVRLPLWPGFAPQ